MDVDKLTKLALRDEDVRELLHKWMAAQKENETLNVTLLARQLADFDKAHTHCHGKLSERMAVLEQRVQDSAKYAKQLDHRLRQVEKD